MPIDTLVPEPVVDFLHGVAVVDPYRWLEDRNTAQTRAWIAGQQERHDDYFSEIPGYEWLRNEVSGFLNVETLEQLTKIGNRYFYRRRRKDQEQACICVREGWTGTERILVVGNRIAGTGRKLIADWLGGRCRSACSSKALLVGLRSQYAIALVYGNSLFICYR